MRSTGVYAAVLGLTALATIGQAQSLDPGSLDPTPATTPDIELDGSIGPGGEVPREGSTWKIGEDLGEYRGQSLFHSFGRFDVRRGQTAEFSAIGGVPRIRPDAPYDPPDRVFARVTFLERSDIEGTLRSTIPGADLYLINPAGVRLAGRAKVDVQGSFHAASAGRVHFQSGATFETYAADPLPLLDYAEPSAYGFLPEGSLQRKDGSPVVDTIEFGRLEADPLRVKAGETFAAVGGNVRITGGVPTFQSPDSTIALVAAGPNASVPLPDLASFHPAAIGEDSALGSVELSLFSIVYALELALEPYGSGSVVVRAGEFALGGNSHIIAQHNDSADTRYPLAVDIEVRDRIGLSEGSTIVSSTSAAGRGGDILLSGRAIEISSGARVLADTSVFLEDELGEGSSILVSTDSLSLSGGGQILNQTRGTGDAGAIVIEPLHDDPLHENPLYDPLSDSLQVALRDGAQILSSTTGAGDSGSVMLRAPDARTRFAIGASDAAAIGTSAEGAGSAGSVSILGSDSITLEGGATIGSRTTSLESDAGNAGGIAIESQQISLRDGAEIHSSTIGVGNTGDVILRAPDAGTGLEIHASNGTLIGTSTQGFGDAGRVSIEGSDSVTLVGGPSGPARIVALADSETADPSVGDAGSIEITTRRLALRNGGQISTSTNGTGNAGKVTVAADTVEIRGAAGPNGANESGIAAQSLGEIAQGGGLAGGVQIVASGDVSLADGGIIRVETASDKPAGEILVRSTGGRVTLDAASIRARSRLRESPAPSGSITIDAAQGVYLSNGSFVDSRSFSQGQAGVVTILAGPRFEASGQSHVSTQSDNAGGGRIEVVADEQVVLTDSSIDTSVELGGGDGGDVKIDPELVVLNRSEIHADARDGDGGRIFIRADQFVRSETSEVTASSRAPGDGVDGEIVITSPEAQLTTERAEPAQEYLDVAGLMRTACGAAGSQSGSFVVTRVGGLPASPEGPLPAPLWEALAESDAPSAGGTPFLAAPDAPRPSRVAALAGGCAAQEEL